MNSQNPTIPQAELTLNHHCPLVTCGQEVRRGERIATSSTPDRGDLHAPVAGSVSYVDAFRIRIESGSGETVDPIDLDDLSGEELFSKLHELGADIPPSTRLDTLIINAADIEPDVFARRTLSTTSLATLERGLKAATSVYTPGRTVLAALKGSAGELPGAERVDISEQYPAALAPLVAMAVTGKEAPENTVVIGAETLFQLGRIMETGLPALETMVTVGDDTEIVTVGTPVGALVEQTGERPEDRDRIVLGGILSGTAAASPRQGIARDTTSVRLVKSPASVAEDAPCVGCGECVRRCPARLDPSMISSYAEFAMYEKANAESVEACFECGLCGFFCIAKRPMLQYIRLAKNELVRAKALSGEE